MLSELRFFFFFFNDPAPTEIYPLPLHAALPIYCLPRTAASEPPLRLRPGRRPQVFRRPRAGEQQPPRALIDRKSTRLNSSHVRISYAVFCLKKKRKPTTRTEPRHLPTRPPAVLT